MFMPCRRALILAGGLLFAAVIAGCTQESRSKQFVEDGPSAQMVWPSATALDVYEHYEPADQRQRDWPSLTYTTADGRVTHPPLYMENPLVDRGTDRVDEDPLGMTASGRNKYRLGGTDILAGLYVYPRFWANLLLMPVSMINQPPCEIRESDGYLSKRRFGYDHDATEADPATPNVRDNHHQAKLLGAPAADTEAQRAGAHEAQPATHEPGAPARAPARSASPMETMSPR
ncbi:MAG: hypothetical protein AB7N71_06845 [Phycisphaerae bacterium]